MAGLRLFRDDSYLTRFDAHVTHVEPAGPGLLLIELDRTAFYPTGGGQPHDTGRLGGLEVVDVQEAAGGGIRHLVRVESAGGTRAGEIPEPVSGEVDWTRRFDHMQQHSGQHILSRAFVQVAGAATRSFHLGAAACSIDLDAGEVTEPLVRRAEAVSNVVIFSDLPVRVREADASSAPGLAAGMNLSRELALKPGEPIRMIGVGDFDETPCGGTHVRRSGEVGAVAIRSWERFKGGTRVWFFCGGRVVRELARLAAVQDACVAKLSAPPDDLPAAIGRLQDQLAGAHKRLKQQAEEIAAAQADGLRSRARRAGERRVVVEWIEGRSAEQLQKLAGLIAAETSWVALLAGADPESGKVSLVFAQAAGESRGDLKMGDLLAAVCLPRGARGGGGPSLARGGGLPEIEARAALEEAFRLVEAGPAPR
ncbi:MAG TPA: alanyl-tRNA editing protein [Candidatus Polarisedimenticolia bacterium]|nr:alanyl-tRNA editing protein [Candidatus Polarisedimenticolia bacterium]